MNLLRNITVFFVALLIPFVGSSLYAATPEGGTVINSLNGADLVRLDKVDQVGYQFGSDIVVVNNNAFPVEVWVKPGKVDNMKLGLITETLVVPAGKNGYLGWLSIQNPDKEGTWALTWSVLKHEDKAPAVAPVTTPTPASNPAPTPASTPVPAVEPVPATQ